MTCDDFYGLVERDAEMSRAERSAWIRHGTECEACAMWIHRQARLEEAVHGPLTEEEETRLDAEVDAMLAEDAADPETRWK